ncbi:MAG: uracil-DNA glycosylase family protein [Candidatus Binatia bacterium]|nr:uracil-DNA glycosylase family protein [Candidatus Binatia bacterium]
MDEKTARAYESGAARWIDDREATPRALRRLRHLTKTLGPGAHIADLGCGPGWYAHELSRRGACAVAFDASAGMLAGFRKRSPGGHAVQGDLAALPFARGSLDAAVAFKAYQHLPFASFPSALAHAHHALRVGAPLELTICDIRATPPNADEAEHGVREHRWEENDFPGRLFSFYDRERLRRILEGAGFTDVRIDPGRKRVFWLWVRATRADTLPDYVRPDLDLLFCGLNPSLLSAQTGVPYGRPGNRFWPAVVRAGLCSRERDPWHALERGIGFTDLVKRPTRGAAELTKDEYATGTLRLEDCVRVFRPRAICFVGLDGWRKTVDRKAVPGWVPDGFAGRPAYLMPSTSGLNAHCDLPGFVRHLRAASTAPG